MSATSANTHEMLLALTADIVSAYVSNCAVAVQDLPILLDKVHKALARLGGPPEPPRVLPPPAVAIRNSIKQDHLVCLEDGKKMKLLKVHLRAAHGMTPDDYRSRWGLASDYPMVAPDYAETRTKIAFQIGLGKRTPQKRGHRKR